MSWSKNQLCDVLLLFVVAVLAFVIGFRSLPSYDAGWHLAGGLWMLAHHSVPQIDPFGAEGAFWLCYSWLFELLLAWAFTLGGFSLLQAIQAFLVVLLALAACLFVRFFALRSNIAGTPIELIPLVILLILTSAFWYLRPQTLSILFFGVLLLLAESRLLRLRFLLPLTILWVNIHIYWLAVPLIAFLYLVLLPINTRTATERLSGLAIAALCGACGLINPYHWRLFSGMFEYAFNHQVGYGLITEFRSLSTDQGLYFFAYLAVLIGLLTRVKYFLGSVSKPMLLLWLLSSVSAFLQIKYLPYFALLSAGLAASVLRTRVHSLAVKAEEKISPALLGLTLASFLAVCFYFIDLEPPRTQRHRELFHVARDLQGSLASTTEQTVVFNDFNDGGWLALAFWQARPEGSESTQLKTSIDGRTLVMGAKRLAEYQQIASRQGRWCSTLAGWGAEYAILPSESALLEALEQDNSEDCMGSWEREGEYQHWIRLAFRPK